MNLKDNQDPLIRLAWLATRIQKRIGIGSFSQQAASLLEDCARILPGCPSFRLPKIRPP